MITVAIIEDNRLVREGIALMLDELPDLKVVLAATTLEVETLKEAKPRVVLVDIGLQDTDCLRVAETVRREMVDSEIIVMDLLPVHEEIVQLVNAGVAGFILKDATFEDFVGTIRSVAGGQRVLPPPMTGTLFSQIARNAVNKIIQGDWPWQGSRDINDKKSVWHNYKGKRTFNMLFGDGHVENYLFPKEYVNWQLSPPYDPKFKWW